MSKELAVKYNGEHAYNIHLERDFGALLSCLESLGNFKNRKLCIVTDSNVAKLYLNEVEELCQNSFSTVTHFIFDAGEASKNLSVIEKLYEHLIKSRFDRSDLLLALGGGVVGDMTGYAAATYMRGISFIQVPTTLVSQVDSSIGGKTGVDFLQYKNMVGAFYMPILVYINTSTLQSLPEVQFQSGMGEVIKHGLIRDKNYYLWLKDNYSAIRALDADTLEELVYVSCQIKRAVVEEDPKEAGIRAHLNFGHTFGHAIEKLSDFTLFHGQCVAIGMVGAAYLSTKNHGLNIEEYNEIISVIKSFDLPTTISGYSPEQILLTTKSDKKMTATGVKFIVLDAIGEAVIDKNYSDEELLEAINVLCE